MGPARYTASLVVLSLALMLNVGAVVAQTDDLQEANQLFKQGQLDRALERVNTYLTSRPKEARARFLKGIILTEQNKPNDAIKVFTDLTQDFPELPEPYNNLAVLYASQGQYDKARNALEMAIRTHPSYATAHENLGDIYAKMASQAYDKALQLDRSNQGAQGKLNMIRELFSGGQKPTRVSLAKAEPSPPPKPTPAAPPAVAAKPAVPPPPAKAAEPPSAPAKAAEPAPKAVVEAPKAASETPKAASGNSDEVVRAIQGWAKAWSTNDVGGYLGHYGSGFKPPKGVTRASWEAERRARIAKPKKDSGRHRIAQSDVHRKEPCHSDLSAELPVR
jgi:tetratricopeptide (TPR) repeat protein